MASDPITHYIFEELVIIITFTTYPGMVAWFAANIEL